LRDGLVLAQKVVSKAEARYLDLAEVVPSQRAADIAVQLNKDARFVEAVLRESRRRLPSGSRFAGRCRCASLRRKQLLSPSCRRRGSRDQA
jgi:F420-0:gamma-glutamyl ligase